MMVNMGHRPSAILELAFSTTHPLGMEVLTVAELLSRPGLDIPSRPHRPDFHHLFLVTRGRGTHVVDFVSYALRTGMAFHVAPGQVHQFGREPGLDAWMVVFRPDAVRQPPHLGSAPQRLPCDRLVLATAVIEGLAREAAGSDGGPRSRALLRTLLEALSLALDVGPPRPAGAALLDRFVAALEAEFRRAHEVAAYAAILRCSPRTLARHCLRWTGRSAKRIIDDRVVLEARRSLAHADGSVAGLASELGFAEPTQFVKFFRHRTGETPGSFRERMRRGPGGLAGK
jgi:AraC-like DNA-binding protein/quercetin dioxygenase-like cupin family protein